MLHTNDRFPCPVQVVYLICFNTHSLVPNPLQGHTDSVRDMYGRSANTLTAVIVFGVRQDATSGLGTGHTLSLHTDRCLQRGKLPMKFESMLFVVNTAIEARL